MSANSVLAQAVGRRKSSTARVVLRPGTGRFSIKGPKGSSAVSLEEYFGRETSRMIASQAIALLKVDQFDYDVIVRGGGNSGQAGAIRHAISRVLVTYERGQTTESAELEESQSWYKKLREAGYMTRDDRETERKKAGLRGARRRRQFSKR